MFRLQVWNAVIKNLERVLNAHVRVLLSLQLNSIAFRASLGRNPGEKTNEGKSRIPLVFWYSQCQNSYIDPSRDFGHPMRNLCFKLLIPLVKKSHFPIFVSYWHTSFASILKHMVYVLIIHSRKLNKIVSILLRKLRNKIWKLDIHRQIKRRVMLLSKRELQK